MRLCLNVQLVRKKALTLTVQHHPHIGQKFCYLQLDGHVTVVHACTGVTLHEYNQSQKSSWSDDMSITILSGWLHISLVQQKKCHHFFRTAVMKKNLKKFFLQELN